MTIHTGASQIRVEPSTEQAHLWNVSLTLEGEKSAQLLNQSEAEVQAITTMLLMLLRECGLVCIGWDSVPVRILPLELAGWMYSQRAR